MNFKKCISTVTNMAKKTSRGTALYYQDGPELWTSDGFVVYRLKGSLVPDANWRMQDMTNILNACVPEKAEEAWISGIQVKDKITRWGVPKEEGIQCLVRSREGYAWIEKRALDPLEAKDEFNWSIKDTLVFAVDKFGVLQIVASKIPGISNNLIAGIKELAGILAKEEAAADDELHST